MFVNTNSRAQLRLRSKLQFPKPRVETLLTVLLLVVRIPETIHFIPAVTVSPYFLYLS